MDKNNPGAGGQNEMPKLLADWLLSGKNYDTDTDTDTETQSDQECPFDVRKFFFDNSFSTEDENS